MYHRNSSDQTWSQNMHERRRALVYSDTASSEENKSQPPPPDSLLPNPPHINEAVKKYSSCSCRKSCVSIDKTNSGTVKQSATAERKIRDKKHRLQQLEVKLYSATLEEATQSDRLDKSQDKLQRADHLLEAQVLYMQSLDLKTRALARLTHLAGNVACKDLAPTETLVQTLDKFTWDHNLLEHLNKVQNTAMTASETSEQFYQLLEEFREKQKNFNDASNNFSQYLREAGKTSSSRLRAYEDQFDSIKGNYDSSRHILESELPKMINKRHEVLQDCFSKLLPVQEKLLDQDKQFFVLSKEIANSLPDAGRKHGCRHSRCDGKPCQSQPRQN